MKVAPSWALTASDKIKSKTLLIKGFLVCVSAFKSKVLSFGSADLLNLV